jgi:hypothetical protein
MEGIKVGGEVEAWCTTCRTMKWHVVVSVVDEKPAKVECIGCHKQHGFRPQAPGTAKPRTAKSTKPPLPETPPIEDLEAKLATGDRDARSYSPMDTYALGDFVRHPTFGVGLVAALPATQKIEVAFRGGRKLLIHRRGETAAPALERPPPRAEEEDALKVTDAPPATPAVPPSTDRH